MREKPYEKSRKSRFLTLTIESEIPPLTEPLLIDPDSFSSSNDDYPMKLSAYSAFSAFSSPQKVSNPPINPYFDPYKVPADIELAENHGKARKIGKFIENPQKVCSCCGLPIEKEPFSLFCSLQELAFLGSAYPFYFDFMKKILLIIFIILMVSGTMKLGLINTNCNEACVTFFGFGVLNLEDYNQQIFTQSGLDTVFSVFLIAFMLGVKTRSFNAIKIFNDKAISARDYTIMVQNIPKFTKKSEILGYFKDLVQKEIVKVNMAYDLREYNSMFNRKLKVVSHLKGLYNEEGLDFIIGDESPDLKKNSKKDLKSEKPYNNEIALLEAENQRLEQSLENFESRCESEKNDLFTGTAFITFKSQTTVRVLIDQWGISLLKTLEYIFIEKFAEPYLKFKGQTIIVHEAPDPTDVIWENLRFSILRTILNHSLLYILSAGILVLSFYIQFQVVLISNDMKQELEKQLEKVQEMNLIVRGAALGISSVTIMINFLLKLTVFAFAILEKPYSHSRFNQSYVTIYILLAFFNSALMPYLVNTFIYSNQTPEQLIWDIHFILLCNAFSTPLFKCLDPCLWLRKLMRVYIRYKGKKCLMTQYNVNHWFENTSIDIAENYAYITRTLLLAVWYSSVAPLGLIYCLMGITVNYWLDKYLLLRVHSFPLYQSEEIIYKFINNLEVIPYLYMYGAIEYHSRIVLSQNLLEWVWSFLFYGISSISLTLFLIFYVMFFKHKAPTRDIQVQSYENIRYLLVSEYDRTNPVTRKKANKDFLQSIENHMGLSPIMKKKLINKATVLLPQLSLKKPHHYWSPNITFKKDFKTIKEMEMMAMSADIRKKKVFSIDT